MFTARSKKAQRQKKRLSLCAKALLPEEKPRVLREEEIVGGEESEILLMDGRNITGRPTDQCCADVPAKVRIGMPTRLFDESDAALR